MARSMFIGVFLFNCHVVKCHVGVFLAWLGWLPNWINTVVGCSGRLASVLCCFRGVLIASLWFVLVFFDAVVCSEVL